MKASGHLITAWILAGIALTAVLALQLLPALLAGLLVYELAHVLAPRLGFLPLEHTQVKMIAVAILSNLIILALIAAGFCVWVLLQDEAGGLTVLLFRLGLLVGRLGSRRGFAAGDGKGEGKSEPSELRDAEEHVQR